MAGHIQSPRPSSIKSLRLDLQKPNSRFETPTSTPSMDVQRLEQSAEILSMSPNIGEEIRKIRQEQKRRDSRSSAWSGSSVSVQQRGWQSGNVSRQSSKRTSSLLSLQFESSQPPFVNSAMRTGHRQAYGSVPRESTSIQHNQTPEATDEFPIVSGTYITQLEDGNGDVIDHEEAFDRVEEHEAFNSHARRPIDGLDADTDDANLEGDETIVETSHPQHGKHDSPTRDSPHSKDLDAPGNVVDDAGPVVEISRKDSSASKTTSRMASSVFRDFDGVHHSSMTDDLVEEVEESLLEVEEGSEPVMERELMMPRLQPPPPSTSDMIYYPAPVPMVLNMPKRISQQSLPLQSHLAKRRSQATNAVLGYARNSTLDLPAIELLEGKGDEHIMDGFDEGKEITEDKRESQRKSNLFTNRLPPQLRASVFFDTPTAAYEVEIQDGSAVNTLDALLDASATAPVERLNVKDKSKRKSKRPKRPANVRASTISLIPGENVSDVRPEHKSVLSARSSSYGMLGHCQSKQRLSLVGEVDEVDDSSLMQPTTILEMSNEQQNIPVAFQNVSKHDVEHDLNMPHDSDEINDQYQYGEGSEEEEEEEEGYSDEDDMAQMHEHQPTAAPATLLAELQLRKRELKQRTRAAATAFPNGMHATLLQLDEVAQIEKKRRQAQHTHLAWEDPLDATARHGDEDEDVPLGILYPSKRESNHRRGLSDWDSPLGLLEKKTQEDNEPLSKRRNRLKGIEPDRDGHSGISVDHDAGSDHESDVPGQTLAERMRSLKTRKALDDALGETNSRPVSPDFRSEVMSQLGGLGLEESEAKAPVATEAPPPPEEETLGQRKARLRAETAQQLEGPAGTRPNYNNIPPRADRSLANLLSSRPPINMHNGQPAAGYTSSIFSGRNMNQSNMSSGVINPNMQNAMMMPGAYMSTNGYISGPTFGGMQPNLHKIGGVNPNLNGMHYPPPNPMMSYAYVNQSRGPAQQQSMDTEASMTNAQRSTIDRWRQGIA